MAPTVLIVDDDPECLRLFSLLLKREGVRVRSALDARAALVILAEEAIDLISLDVILPDIDGLRLCRRLRQSGGYINKPILLLSARASEPDRQEGLAAGADAYFNKVTETTEWVAMVAELLAEPIRYAPSRAK